MASGLPGAGAELGLAFWDELAQGILAMARPAELTSSHTHTCAAAEDRRDAERGASLLTPRFPDVSV